MADERLSGRRRRKWHHDDSDAGSQALPEPEWEKFQLQKNRCVAEGGLGVASSSASPFAKSCSANRLDLDLVEGRTPTQSSEGPGGGSSLGGGAEDRRGPKRTYWVEQGGEWGMVLDDKANNNPNQKNLLGQGTLAGGGVSC